MLSASGFEATHIYRTYKVILLKMTPVESRCCAFWGIRSIGLQSPARVSLLKRAEKTQPYASYEAKEGLTYEHVSPGRAEKNWIGPDQSEQKPENKYIVI